MLAGAAFVGVLVPGVVLSPPAGRVGPGYQPLGGRPKVCCLSLWFPRVDRVFLATVMRHYAERPEHRRDIGTPAERDRLSAGFAAWRTQSGVPVDAASRSDPIS